MTVKQKQQQQGRGLGNKRCVRKSVSLCNDLDQKSKALAVSCNMSQAELLHEVIKLSLNSSNIIQYLQDKYTTNEKFRVIPTKVNGKLYYS